MSAVGIEAVVCRRRGGVTVAAASIALASMWMLASTANADPPCAHADIDGDADVDQDDLGALLAAFGTCQGDQWFNAAADTNGDNCVNQQDLGAVLECYGQEWDPCQGNQPPVANASGPAQADVNTPVAFSSAGSNDPDGTIVSWQWNFGDNGTSSQPNPTHTYANPGNYTVTLTVRDDCNASHTKQMSIQITQASGEPLQAAFEPRMYVGDDQWATVGLSAGNPIEKGLKVMLDGSLSSGDIAYYFWQIGSNTYYYTEQPIHQFGFSGSVQVRLTVYDADWNESSVVKTVYLSEMVQLSSMPSPGETFMPVMHALNGSKVWAISTTGRIGVGNIANPSNLPAMTLMSAVVSDARGMAYGNGKLYVARGAGGLNVYNASEQPGQFSLIKTYSTTQLGGEVNRVAAAGDVAYVALASPNRVRVYSFSNPLQAQELTSFSLPGAEMSLSTAGVLVGHDGGGTMWVVDARVPQAPELVTSSHGLGASFSYGIASSSNSAAISHSSKVSVVRFNVPESLEEPITISESRQVNTPCLEYCVSPERLYTLVSGKIYKRDVAWSPDYEIEAEPGIQTNVTESFVTDPDGDGPLGPTVFIHQSYGYFAFSGG